MKILIDDDISPWYGVTAERINRQLKSATGDITVEISSDGGDVFEGVRIFNLLKNYSKGEITTVAMSQAISIASYIFLAGKHRVVYDNSIYMIHNASNGARGDYRLMAKNSDTLKRVTDIMSREYARATQRSKEEVDNELDEETWFFGQEILDSGFATEVRVSGEIENTDKNDNISNFKQQKIVCDSKNAEECLKNFKRDEFIDNLYSVDALLVEMNSPSQKKENNMEKTTLNGVKIFLATASAADKTMLAIALGTVDSAQLTAKQTEITTLTANHEDAIKLSKDNHTTAMTNAVASVKTILSMVNDDKFSKIPQAEKVTALEKVTLSNDGTVNTNELHIALLSNTLASQAPQAGEVPNVEDGDYSQFENNQDSKIGGNK